MNKYCLRMPVPTLSLSLALFDLHKELRDTKGWWKEPDPREKSLSTISLKIRFLKCQFAQICLLWRGWNIRGDRQKSPLIDDSEIFQRGWWETTTRIGIRTLHIVGVGITHQAAKFDKDRRIVPQYGTHTPPHTIIHKMYSTIWKI